MNFHKRPNRVFLVTKLNKIIYFITTMKSRLWITFCNWLSVLLPLPAKSSIYTRMTHPLVGFLAYLLQRKPLYTTEIIRSEYIITPNRKRACLRRYSENNCRREIIFLFPMNNVSSVVHNIFKILWKECCRRATNKTDTTTKNKSKSKL